MPIPRGHCFAGSTIWRARTTLLGGTQWTRPSDFVLSAEKGVPGLEFKGPSLQFRAKNDAGARTNFRIGTRVCCKRLREHAYAESSNLSHYARKCGVLTIDHTNTIISQPQC